MLDNVLKMCPDKLDRSAYRPSAEAGGTCSGLYDDPPSGQIKVSMSDAGATSTLAKGGPTIGSMTVA